MEAFIKLLSNYKQEAFRLETLPIYDVSEERESFDTFLQTGAVVLDDDLADYIHEHAQHIRFGKQHIRARVVPDPITDYFIYETKVWYIPQHDVGFKHYFLDFDVYKQKFTSVRDFWLFDDETVVYMNYDATGKFLWVDIMDDELSLSTAIMIKNIFWEMDMIWRSCWENIILTNEFLLSLHYLQFPLY
jgi:hypothetical protein